MKPIVTPVVGLLLLAGSLLAAGAEVYTVVPAGAAGPDLFFDKIGPDLEGDETLPIVDRLPRVARQPLWATYEIGEPITGGCRLYDEEGKLARGAGIIVELYRLSFYRQHVFYELIYRERVRCDPSSGIYRFSIPTEGLESDYYQVRLGLPNGTNIDPEFRVEVGDAVFNNEVAPPGYEGGCGCS